MRTLLLFSLLLSTLGNADIVKLVKAGLSAETIEAKIAASETKFDTSTDALVALAESGVPDRVIRAMIGAKPAAPVAAAPVASPAPPKPAAPQLPSRRYDVTLHAENGGKCEGELRVDGKGIKATRCKALDFEIPWSKVESACYTYGFRGTVTVNGRQISTTTPAEAKRIVDQLATRITVKACD